MGTETRRRRTEGHGGNLKMSQDFSFSHHLGRRYSYPDITLSLFIQGLISETDLQAISILSRTLSPPPVVDWKSSPAGYVGVLQRCELCISLFVTVQSTHRSHFTQTDCLTCSTCCLRAPPPCRPRPACSSKLFLNHLSVQRALSFQGALRFCVSGGLRCVQSFFQPIFSHASLFCCCAPLKMGSASQGGNSKSLGQRSPERMDLMEKSS